MEIKISPNTQKILRRLIDRGYASFLVGGTVRDLLLNNVDLETIKDIDIATSALPEQIEKTFENYFLFANNKKFGTISIRYKNMTYDITTFRIDNFYSNGRHPDSVEFTSELIADLARRDITINAVALSINGDIIDPFDGLTDLSNSIIKCVGDPLTRFKEDYLRLLRVIRFSTKLAFEIDPLTLVAMEKASKNLIKSKVSEERIFTELNQITKYEPKSGMLLLLKTGLYDVIFLEAFQEAKRCFSSRKEIIAYISSFEFVCKFEEDGWVYLLHLLVINRPYTLSQIDSMLRRLKGMNKLTRQYVSNQLYSFSTSSASFNAEKITKGDIEKWIIDVRSPFNQANSKFWKFSVITQFHLSKNAFTSIGKPDRENVSKIYSILNEFTQKYDSLKFPMNGNDVKACGVFGRTIRNLLKLWKNMFYRNPGLQKSDYLEVGKLLHNHSYLDFQEYLHAVAKESPSYSKLEIDNVREELINLKTLALSLNGILLIYLKTKDFVYFENISEIQLEYFGIESITASTSGVFLVESTKFKKLKLY